MEGVRITGRLRFLPVNNHLQDVYKIHVGLSIR